MRNSTKDFVRFLCISLGSLAEIETQLEIAIQLNYTDSIKTGNLRNVNSIQIEMKQLRNLINSLKNKL